MRRHTSLICLSAFGLAIACLPRPAYGQTDDEVKQLIDQLDHATFAARRQATQTLEGYIKNNQLTPGQFGILRTYPQNPPLELQRRKESILARWATEAFPVVTKVLNLVRFRIDIGEFGFPFSRFGNFYSGFLPTAEGGRGRFVSALSQKYEAARNALTAADTGRVVPLLMQLKDFLDANYSFENGDFLRFTVPPYDIATKPQVIARVQQAIDFGAEAIDAINVGSNNMQGPPRMTKLIDGGGAIDVGRTLHLALADDPVADGGLDVFMTPYDLAISQPPAGYRAVGELFSLLSTDTLNVSGNTIAIGLEYGDTDLWGNSILNPEDLRIARMANGQAQILEDYYIDTANSRITAYYSPEYVSYSSSGGLDQFGEFVLVRAVPEPRTLALLGVGYLALMVCSRRERRVQGRHSRALLVNRRLS